MPTGNGQPRTYVTSNPGDWTPGNTLYTPLLLEELRADPALAGNQVERVDTQGAELEVDLEILLWFPNVLTAPEEAAADAVVLAHNGAPPDVPADTVTVGTALDGQILAYDNALVPPGYKNVTMSGDATIDKDGVVTVTAGGVFGSEFQQFESLGQSSTPNTTYTQLKTWSTAALPLGNYLFYWSGDSGVDSNKEAAFRLQRNNSVTLMESNWKFDMGLAIAQGAPFIAFSGSAYLAGISGVQTFDWDAAAQSADSAYFENVRAHIFRVS